MPHDANTTGHVPV